MTQKTLRDSRKIWKWLKIGLVILFLGLMIRGVIWVTYARPPLADAVAALESDADVAVVEEPWLAFSPMKEEPKTGFIFYPGGRINPQGYAAIMHSIAAEGYLVVIPEMPINMAAFKPNLADEIISAYPEIAHWVIGGHSVGGTMAAQYTKNHPGQIDGLIIWASYPADNADISAFDLPVSLIYGELDPRVNAASVAERKHLLPADTVYVVIEGGDHHQFGSYQIKPEEHHAVFSRADQFAEIIQATLRLLESVQIGN
jgi:pimeloyl-ACP methyl ester carboxylesterase